MLTRLPTLALCCAALLASAASTQPWVDAFSFRVRTDSMDPTTLLTVTQRVPDGGAALLLLATGLGTLLVVALASRLPASALRVARARE